MGKKEYCTYCFEFSSGRIWEDRRVDIPGCEECHNRHEAKVCALESRLTSLEREIDQTNSSYELLSETLAKTSRELLNQKTEYEQALSELTLKSSLAVDEQRKKVQFLQNCRDSLLEEDVVLAIGPGLEVTAHATILAAKSPVIKRIILNSKSARKSANSNQTKMVIQIDDVPHPVLEAVVDFLYCGELTFSDLVRSDEVLKAAHTFELGLLKEYCDAELCRALSVDNVPRMLKLARKFEASRLQEEASELFKENFDMLKSQVYEILERPDNCTILIAESSSDACPELDEQWNLDQFFTFNAVTVSSTKNDFM